MVIAFVNRPNGDFTFTGDTTQRTGNAAADFLLGLPAQFRRTTTNTPQDGHGWLYAGYAQDEFRPRPNVTINAGLRYEVSVPFVDENDALNAFRPGQQSTRFPEAPLGLVYPGDPGVPRGTYETDKNNFAPRLGAGVGSRPATAARACAPRGASSTTRSPGRATSSRTACSRRRSRRCSRSTRRRPR